MNIKLLYTLFIISFINAEGNEIIDTAKNGLTDL